jgi:hypothetical protein
LPSWGYASLGFSLHPTGVAEATSSHALQLLRLFSTGVKKSQTASTSKHCQWRDRNHLSQGFRPLRGFLPFQVPYRLKPLEPEHYGLAGMVGTSPSLPVPQDPKRTRPEFCKQLVSVFESLLSRFPLQGLYFGKAVHNRCHHLWASSHGVTYLPATTESSSGLMGSPLPLQPFIGPWGIPRNGLHQNSRVLVSRP